MEEMDKHWLKLQRFVQEAKMNQKLANTMKQGTDWDKILALKEFGFTDGEISALQEDLASISEPSLRASWWSF